FRPVLANRRPAFHSRRRGTGANFVPWSQIWPLRTPSLHTSSRRRCAARMEHATTRNRSAPRAHLAAGALLSSLLSSPLHAQDAASASTATSAAADAFGEQVGTERIGLYNLYQTRGFDLVGSSGAFR